MTILDLDAYPKLMQYLFPEDKKQLAQSICEMIIKYQFKLTDVVQTKKLTNFIEPIIVSNLSNLEKSEDKELDLYMFQVQQNLVAMLVHLIDAKSAEEHFQILSIFHKLFVKRS